ncbi:MAG: cytochrome C [Sideroxydans sp.]|nr:cytochrome C [Sideroxydans sp.]
MSLDYRNLLRMFVAVFLLAGLMSATHAEDDDEDEEEGGSMPVVVNTTWQTECSACHLAYPPSLLPAKSWRAVMSGLDKHFGTDASLTSSESKEVSAFLEENAGEERNTSSRKPLLRITQTNWFVHEHDEVSKRTWMNPKVKSPANCVACHKGAENGDFDEDNIRIPK